MLFCLFSEPNWLPEAPNDHYTRTAKSGWSSLAFTSSYYSVLSCFSAKIRNQPPVVKLLQCRCFLLPKSFLPPLWLPTDLGGPAVLNAGRSFAGAAPFPVPATAGSTFKKGSFAAVPWTSRPPTWSVRAQL